MCTLASVGRLLTAKSGGTMTPPLPTNYLLLSDGTSFLLLSDGVGRLVLVTPS